MNFFKAKTFKAKNTTQFFSTFILFNFALLLFHDFQLMTVYPGYFPVRPLGISQLAVTPRSTDGSRAKGKKLAWPRCTGSRSS